MLASEPDHRPAVVTLPPEDEISAREGTSDMQITQAESLDLLAQVLIGDEEGYFSGDCVPRSGERAVAPPEQRARQQQKQRRATGKHGTSDQPCR
jgi:hypothetical protein